MATRADFRTALAARRRPTYSDVALSFALNPVTDSLAIVEDEECVAQFLRCLILTMTDEWAFEPGNGSWVRRSLFDPSDQVTLDLISETISQAVAARAPMVSLVGVRVVPRFDGTSAEVTLAYRVVGRPAGVSTLTIVLRRIR